jgi:endonuclease-3
VSPARFDSPLWECIDERLRREVRRRRPTAARLARAAAVADVLAREFPRADCALHFTTPFELLVATILSAQCTDARVNMVTPALFRKYPRPADYRDAPEGALEADIRSTGFYNTKARAIREMAATVCERFGGEIPVAMEDLLTLRGAARKTANVVRMHAFHLPGIAVDTHVTRLSRRLGLTRATDPEKIEFDLAALLPPERWTHFADALILHGRKTCHARNPRCGECPMATLCPTAGTHAAKSTTKPRKARSQS